MQSLGARNDRARRLAAWSRWLLHCLWTGPVVTIVFACVILADAAAFDDAWDAIQVDLFLGLLLCVACGMPSLWTGLLIVRDDHLVLRWVAPLRAALLAAIGVLAILMTECSLQTGIWPAPYIPFPWASPRLLLLSLLWCGIAATVTWRWSVDVRRSPQQEARWGDYLFLTELFWLCPCLPHFLYNISHPVVQIVTCRWTGAVPAEAEVFRAWWKLALLSLLSPLVGYAFSLLMVWMFRIDGWGMIAVLIWSLIVTAMWATVFLVVSLVLGMWLAQRRRSLIKWVAPQMAVVLGFLAFVNVWISMAGLRYANVVTGVVADQLNFVAIPLAIVGAIAVTAIWSRWVWRKAGELQDVKLIEAESRPPRDVSHGN